MAGAGFWDSTLDLLKKGTNAIGSNLSLGGGIQGMKKQIVDRELDTAKTMLSGLDEASSTGKLTEDALKGYAKTAGSKEHDIESIRKAGQSNVSRLEGATPETYKEALGYKNDVAYGGRLAREYMWNSANGAQKATRIGVAAGGYMAGSALLRGAANFGTNSKGESDIAGIPFI